MSKKLLLLLLSVSATTASAQSMMQAQFGAPLGAPVAAPQDVPKETLSQLTSETVLLKAKAAEATARALSEGGTTGGQSTGPVVNHEEIEAPTVLGVFGPSTATYARVGMPDGTHVDAPSGQVLPGGHWRVEISDGAVRLIPVTGEPRSKSAGKATTRKQ